MNKSVKTEECGWTTALRMSISSSDEQTSSSDKGLPGICQVLLFGWTKLVGWSSFANTIWYADEDLPLPRLPTLRILFTMRMKTCLCEDFLIADTVHYADEDSSLRILPALRILFTMRMKTRLCEFFLLCGYYLICGWSQALCMWFSLRVLFALRITRCFSDELILRE